MIVGDANLAEVATFFKVGTTALVLALIEDDAFDGVRPRPGQPGAGHPPGLATTRRCREPLELRRRPHASPRSSSSGSCYGLARKYAEDRGLECLGRRERGPDGARSAGRRSSTASRPTRPVARQLDWVAKLQLIEAYRERHGLDWDDQRLAALDLQYHDLRPERSLFARLDTERLVDEDEVLRGRDRAAATTRAYFRGQCLKRWASSWPRQLGLARLRPRDRPAAAGPDDGSAAGHGRACR